MAYTKGDLLQFGNSVSSSLEKIGDQIKKNRHERYKNEILEKYKSGEVFVNKDGTPRDSNQITSQSFTDMMALNDLGFKEDASLMDNLVKQQSAYLNQAESNKTFLGILQPEDREKFKGANLERSNLQGLAPYVIQKELKDNWKVQFNKYDDESGTGRIKTIKTNSRTGEVVVVADDLFNREFINKTFGSFSNTSTTFSNGWTEWRNVLTQEEQVTRQGTKPEGEGWQIITPIGEDIGGPPTPGSNNNQNQQQKRSDKPPYLPIP